MGTIAQKLEYLNDTRLLLKDNINKINNVLDDNSTFRSYPQELFNGYLDVLNNGTDTLWNNLEKVSQTGTEAVLENVETAPMKVELQGNTQQNGEPTPDTPIPVQVVTGENVVSVQGENLLPYTEQTFNEEINGVTFTGEKGVYTISGTPEGSSVISTLYSLLEEYTIKEGDYLHLLNNATSGVVTFSLRFTDGTYLAPALTPVNRIFNLSNYVGKIVNKINLYSTVQYTGEKITLTPMILNNVSTYTDFAPYSKTDYPINLGDIELCKIGNYKDYLFKRNGKWYKYKAIGKVVFNGSEEEWFQSGNYFRIQISNSKSGTNCRSNYFVAGNQDNQFLVYTDNYLGFRYGVLNNILADWKTWLSTHNTIVYYVLTTPTEEEITNSTLIEQLEAISKAKSVKDKTYITQANDDLPFILDVQAIKEYEVV